jgi:hypothetical protein
MEQRLAAGDGDHGRAALFDGGETLLGGELLFEDVGRILHLAAAGAGQVAAEERLQHEHQRIALAAPEPVLEDVGCDRTHLGDWNCHQRFSSGAEAPVFVLPGLKPRFQFSPSSARLKSCSFKTDRSVSFVGTAEAVP